MVFSPNFSNNKLKISFGFFIVKAFKHIMIFLSSFSMHDFRYEFKIESTHSVLPIPGIPEISIYEKF